MSIFSLPDWVIKEIDRTRRNFLWHRATIDIRKIHLANWSSVCTPKTLGGLGVIDLKTFNHALLTKWRWQWHESKQRAWKQLMEALYCAEGKQHITNSFLFDRHLKATEKICYTFCRWQPGSGDSIIFWSCDWGKGILQHRFPTLYTYAISIEVTLQQVARSPAITSLFRPVLSTQAIVELRVLEAEMQYLPQHQQTAVADEIRWIPDSDGKFTVKSAYYELKKGTAINTKTHRIWKLRAPPRYKVFEWLMQGNKILTTDNLKTRGYSMAGLCYMCRASDETVKHLFSECGYSKEIYSMVMQMGTVQATPTQMCNITATTEGNLSKKGKSILLLSHFTIWRERCNRVFKNQMKDQDDLLQEISDVWRSMRRTTRPQMLNNNCKN